MDIVSIGECMIEFHCDSSNIYKRGFAGDTLNVIVAAARLGSTVSYLTKVSDDLFGSYLIDEWKKENIDISQVKLMKNSFTGIYFIQFDQYGERSFSYYRKGSSASTMTADDFNKEFFCKAKVFYSSGITQSLSLNNRRTVVDYFETFSEKKQQKQLIAYDPNYREQLWGNNIKDARKAQEEILPYVDIVLPSFPADSPLVQAKTPEEMMNYYMLKGIEKIVIKMGKNGCIFTNNGGKTISKYPAIQTPKVVDTTGAGDAFNGGLLYGLVQDYSFLKGVKVGTIVASMKIMGRGAISHLPRLKDIKPFLNE